MSGEADDTDQSGRADGATGRDQSDDSDRSADSGRTGNPGRTDDTSGQTDDPDGPTDAEKQALHEMQVGVEHVGRARGRLLDFHHEIGDAFDHFEAARERLREAGYDELADELRDRHLPAGVIGDRWTYELVEAFEDGFLTDVAAFDERLREEVGDGEPHRSERDLQSTWRERAETDAWRED